MFSFQTTTSPTLQTDELCYHLIMIISGQTTKGCIEYYL